MDGSIEALAYENDGESERQNWQSSEVSQPQIARKEIAHVCAEDTCEAERHPVTPRQAWAGDFVAWGQFAFLWHEGRWRGGVFRFTLR